MAARLAAAATERGTRDEILDVAEELIQTRGSNGISYATISERVGVRKASIHHHFPTKDQLITELVDRYSKRFLAAVDGIIGSSDPPKKKLKRYVSLFDGTLKAPPGQRVCLCGMLGAELSSLPPDATSKLRRFYQENERRLATILEEGRDDGSFEFEGDARTLGMSLFSFLEGAMIVARADGGTRQFRDLSDRFMGLLSA